jgi:hypothetical protein
MVAFIGNVAVNFIDNRKARASKSVFFCCDIGLVEIYDLFYFLKELKNAKKNVLFS